MSVIDGKTVTCNGVSVFSWIDTDTMQQRLTACTESARAEAMASALEPSGWEITRTPDKDDPELVNLDGRRPFKPTPEERERFRDMGHALPADGSDHEPGKIVVIDCTEDDG